MGKFFLVILTLFQALVLTFAFNWNSGDGAKWSSNCDFNGGDIGSVQSSGEQCGGKCKERSGCTHFVWTNYNGGTCWLKHFDTPQTAVAKNDGNAVCGWLEGNTPSGGGWVNNVKGTFWGESTDPGGCQLPSAAYSVPDAIALGQANSLGYLRWRPGLCGQILNIDCGHGSFPAVVGSTCNLGSNSCGVDMIRRTWNRATGNASPGITTCRASLSSSNPITGTTSPVCFHRPNSENGNQYYRIIGVLNTSGRILKTANLAGIIGNRFSGDGWFEFNAAGRPAFNPSSQVTFEFEDGSKVNFSLGDCKNGGQTQIFQ